MKKFRILLSFLLRFRLLGRICASISWRWRRVERSLQHSRVGLCFFRTCIGRSVAPNDVRIRMLKDRHRGERCFIIGNGPSLQMSDLDMLVNDVTFASNKIYLGYENTVFRPTYYSIIDPYVADAICDTVSSMHVSKLFTSGLWDVLGFDRYTTYIHDDGGLLKGFCGDPQGGSLYGGCTVVFFQLQLAYFMGFQEVYLIGMDHNWHLPQGPVQKEGDEMVLVSEGERNHFHSDYRMVGEKWTLPKPKIHEQAFGLAREYYEKHGRQVFNATRGGFLEVFPRANLDDLI